MIGIVYGNSNQSRVKTFFVLVHIHRLKIWHGKLYCASVRWFARQEHNDTMLEYCRQYLALKNSHSLSAAQSCRMWMILLFRYLKAWSSI